MDDHLTDASALAGIRNSLLDWYQNDHRDFPWRRTTDPYAILVSEVMLQQTQASRIAERFPIFIRRFPTAAALAAATEAQVLAAWSGLGYNRRALALRRAVARVATHGWPQDVAALERLPAIGPYTARAVASLAFGEPVGVVDTNVRRWLVRRFGLRPETSARELQALADGLAAAGSSTDAAPWTHATMEFGAGICTPRNPHCEACPISEGCPSRSLAILVPVPRQPAFVGSDRAHRGTLLRALTRAPDHSMALRSARNLVPAGVGDRIVLGLERDGLVHRSRGHLLLGGRPEPVATIGS